MSTIIFSCCLQQKDVTRFRGIGPWTGSRWDTSSVWTFNGFDIWKRKSSQMSSVLSCKNDV